MNLFRGICIHFVFQLRSHVRNRQALVYSLALPVLFLAGFAAVFRAGEPPLAAQAGQLLTLTLLGGSCFGLPVTLVSERQAGLWRRHRLLPVSEMWILASVILARCVVLSASIALQVGVAVLVFGMPPPAAPFLLLATLALAMASFLGIGLLVAASADTVPSVQALGQCLFLPVVILGGVGVPVSALPEWARVFSAFTPGRYAVELLQGSWTGASSESLLPWMALVVMGGGGCVAGMALFRWSPVDRPRAPGRLGALAGLAPWVAVGLWAAGAGRIAPGEPVPFPEFIEESRIRAIDTSGLPADDSLVTPMRPKDRAGDAVVLGLLAALPKWETAAGGEPRDRVRFVISAAALADAAQDVLERDLALASYLHLTRNVQRSELRRILAWIALTPERGSVALEARALGVRRVAPEALVRERTRLYALKFLVLLEREEVTSSQR